MCLNLPFLTVNFHLVLEVLYVSRNCLHGLSQYSLIIGLTSVYRKDFSTVNLVPKGNLLIDPFTSVKSSSIDLLVFVPSFFLHLVQSSK